MAHYVWNTGVPLGARLRQGLDSLQDAQHKLLDVLGAMNQMTDTQITQAFGFADDTTSGAARAELSADAANLQSGDGTGSTAAGRALQQMLDQFSG